MARFASQHPNLTVGVRNARAEQNVIGADGRPAVLPGLRALEARFSHNLMTEKDAIEAKSRLRFTGTVEDEGGRPVDPTYRIGVFDSEVSKLQKGWTDDEEKLVVEAVRNSGENGRSYVEIVPDPVAKPWPGYDEVETAEQIVQIAQTIGADFDQILAYELENRNSTSVLTALREAKAEENDVVIVSA